MIGRRCRRELRFAHGAGTPGRDVEDAVPYNGRRSRDRLRRDVEDAVPYNGRCSRKTNDKQTEKTARKRAVFNLKKHFAAYSIFTKRQALTDQTVSIRFPVCAVCACLSPGC